MSSYRFWSQLLSPHFKDCLHLLGKLLTHRGRVMHICVNELTIIGSDNGLSPGRRQAIIWTSVIILSVGTLGTNFSEIFIEILTFSFKKMRLKKLSAKWRPFCIGLNKLSWLSGLIILANLKCPLWAENCRHLGPWGCDTVLTGPGEEVCSRGYIGLLEELYAFQMHFFY